MKKILFLLSLSLIVMALSTSSFMENWKYSEIFKPAGLSVAVYDLGENKFILRENSEKVLTSASIQKLFSTAIAIHSLGPKHQFETKLAYTGTIVDGGLRGDIYIFPNFNPTLGNKKFNRDLSEVTGVIKSWLSRNKVKTINGIKIIDSTLESETLPRTWLWEDIGNYYGANPCGTVFNENIVELYFESGKPGEQTKIVKKVPDLPLLHFENRVKASKQNKDLAYCFGGPYDKGLIIEGTIPANRRNFKVKAALQRPQRGLSYLVYNALKKSGIIIKGQYGAYSKPQKKYKQFAVVKSAFVEQIAKRTNHKSVNILAENLLQNSYRVSNSNESMETWVKNYLKTQFDIDVSGMRIKDGSGLSCFNAVSSKQFVELLIKMKDNDAFKKSIPVAGKSGTVRSFLKNSPLNGKVRCKSGSMTGVRSYAGYLDNEGKRYAFSIIVNNPGGSDSEVITKIEELLNYINSL